MCETKMSAFIFTKKNNTWRLNKRFIKFANAGSYGDAIPKDKIGVYPVHKNDFMITMEKSNFYHGNNVNSALLNIYLSKGNIVELVGDIDIYYDDYDHNYEPYSSWKGQYFIIENENEIPKILVKKIGLEKGKYVRKTEMYIYINGKYKLKK